MGRNEAENLTATTAPGAQYSLKSSPGEDQILQKMLDSIDEVIALEDSGKITPDQAREHADAATHTAMEAISELRMRKRSEEPPARAIVTYLINLYLSPVPKDCHLLMSLFRLTP